jgi:tetratricopeptide (TPR) repeat protein
MAMAEHPENEGNGAQKKAISPAKRKRLQQCFEHANRMMAQENYEYAITLLSSCVVGDPSDFHFLQSFLGCLKKKYNNNKKGDNLAFIKGASLRRSVSKAESSQDWDGVFKAGVEALKLNPWDVQTLVRLAAACKELTYDEVELAYLKTALEANSKDAEICRLCAIALRERKQFDQAIAMWHRVEQIRPNDEESQRAIASLAVEKTIAQGGYEDTDSGKKKTSGQTTSAATSELSAVEKLLRDIKRKPDDLPAYLELAALYLQEEIFEKAVDILGRALEVSGQDPDVREKWEDAQLRLLRQQYAVAEKNAREGGSEEARQQLKELKKQINTKELEVYKNRCERYPNNLSFKYDLGIRYQLNGMFNEAIAEFQQAHNDPRRKGLCLLALGQCFQQIRQLGLAKNHYEAAVEEIPDRDPDNKKLALYLAGKLSLYLHEYDAAERILTSLAARDFAYKDVALLLDKAAKGRENQAKLEEAKDDVGHPPKE